MTQKTKLEKQKITDGKGKSGLLGSSWESEKLTEACTHPLISLLA